MKKYIILFLFALLLPCYATAQSSMTDEQILKFVMKENAEGTSQAQIVTKLMQKGVNDSIVHEDIMIGTPDMDIVGITIDKKEVPIFINGEWAK